MDQLAENLFRLDLQPIEQARAFKRLMDAHGWSARRLAEELHIDHDKVSRAVRLLELPEDIQEQVEAGAVPRRPAAVLAGVEDDATRRELAGRVAAGELTRDEVGRAGPRGTAGRAAARRRAGGRRPSPAR